VALISYNGYYKDQIPRVTVHTGLTDDIGSLYADVRDLQAIGDTGIADALAEARELINDEHEDGFDKVIILFTDGATNIVSHELNNNRVLPLYDGAGIITNGATVLGQALSAATAQATAIKADGTTLIVIGYDIKRYQNYYNTIKNQWASTGFYYDAETGDQLVEVFSELFLDLCEAHEEASGDVSAGTNNP